jgi:hypothetical protein
VTAAAVVAPGVVDTPGADPYPNDMDVITEPAELPADVASIPDDTQIGPAVWAKLQGVALSTVYRNNTLAGKNRAAEKPKPGDMPAPVRHIGQTPVWPIGGDGSYRAWEASRPGKGAGAGRPRNPDGPKPRERATLPINCPHCHHDITAADLASARAANAAGKTRPAGRTRPATRTRSARARAGS